MQVVIGTKSGKTFQKEVEESKLKALFGLQIGDSFQGDIIGLTGFKLVITGGSDKDGFPMSRKFEGYEKKRRLLTKGTGMRNKRDGLRVRKSIRGRMISEDLAQLNVKVETEGEKKIEDILGLSEEIPEAAPKGVQGMQEKQEKTKGEEKEAKPESEEGPIKDSKGEEEKIREKEERPEEKEGDKEQEKPKAEKGKETPDK